MENNDDLPLPELVESSLLRCAPDGQALKTGPSAVLIECRDCETADTVATHKQTSSLCLRAGAKAWWFAMNTWGNFARECRSSGSGWCPDAGLFTSLYPAFAHWMRIVSGTEGPFEMGETALPGSGYS